MSCNRLLAAREAYRAVGGPGADERLGDISHSKRLEAGQMGLFRSEWKASCRNHSILIEIRDMSPGFTIQKALATAYEIKLIVDDFVVDTTEAGGFEFGTIAKLHGELKNESGRRVPLVAEIRQSLLRIRPSVRVDGYLIPAVSRL